MFKQKQIATAVLSAMAVAVQAQTAQTPQAGEPTRIERVEITGSSIKRIAAEGALPVQVLTREDVQKTGATSVEQLLQTIGSANSAGGIVASSASGATTGGISTVSLRGLTGTRTLVLVNGRRITAYGQLGDSASVDVNSIPISAIDRVEVLKDGASAIYGSDAIAGVINFILRRDYSGGEVMLEHGDSTQGGGAVSRAVATVGFGDLGADKYNVVVVATHQREQGLFGRDRAFAASGINEAALNDTSSGNTFPANILLPDGSSRNPAVPNCSPSVLSPLFPPNRCRFDPSPLVSLLPKTERTSIFASGTLALSSTLEAFAQVSYARGKLNTVIQPVPLSDQFALPANNPLFFSAPYFDPARNGSFSTIVLQPGTPFYPTAYVQSQIPAGDPLPELLVRYRSVETGNRDITNLSDQSRVVLGLKGLAAGWDFDTALLSSRSKLREQVKNGFPILSKILPLLNSGQVNFFGPNTAAVQAQLQAAEFTGVSYTNKTALTSLAGKASRELMALPAGPLAAAVGAEFRRESFSSDPALELQQGDVSGYGGNNLPVDKSRNIKAVYGELNIPILKGLEGNLAVRSDSYQGSGSATTPKVGVRWTPMPELLLRASVGRGFRAPSLTDLFSPRVQGVTATGVSDPLRCDTTSSSNDCATQFPTLIGGNEKLEPEKSTNKTIGVVIEPTKNVSAAIDLFQIDLKNTITYGVNPFQILGDLDRFGSLVRRGAVDPNFPTLPGPIVEIDQTTLNLGETKLRGIDLDFKLNIPTGGAGRVNFGLAGTYYLKYDIQAPDKVFQNGIDQPSISGSPGGVIPRWRSNTSVGWTGGPWSATLIHRYQKAYYDVAGTFEDSSDPAYVPRRVGAYEIFDVQGSYSGWQGLVLTLGVKNIFDKDPPYTNNGGQASFQAGYDPTYADPRGRFVYVNATYKFK
ncbi:MAG: TonB-dependent receptor [Burkholderiaceae bacterium]